MMAAPDDSPEDEEHKIRTILIVEDEPDIGMFIADALKLEKLYRIFLASDAVHALEAVKTIVPDLFLLDYNLPGINGLELADHFRVSDSLKHIPILIMSAHLPKQELKERHLASIEKPFEVDDLLRTIENLLGS